MKKTTLSVVNQIIMLVTKRAQDISNLLLNMLSTPFEARGIFVPDGFRS
jgi:hypothetical protein